jgi:transcriptional regulator with XRE-family HTH domain
MLCVDTPAPKSWPERDAFFEWFDERKRIVKIKHDSAVARRAGLDPSSVSSWRSGRQRPSAVSLSAIADVLQAGAQDTWARAGLMTKGDVKEIETPTIREDLAYIANLLKDPNTPAEDLAVIEMTLDLLMSRLGPEAKPRQRAA